MFIGQEFLRNPDRYVRVGARPPRGVLLVSNEFKQILGIEATTCKEQSVTVHVSMSRLLSTIQNLYLEGDTCSRNYVYILGDFHPIY